MKQGRRRLTGAVMVAIGMLPAVAARAQLPRLDDLIKGRGAGLTGGSEGAAGSRSDATGTGATGSGTGATGSGDSGTDIAGIKEALATGTERAITSLAAPDGYFGNEAVRILVPSSLRKATDLARMAGMQDQVDAFVLSMNRAAEAAVPLASQFFGDAIRSMSLADARAILTGGDTAATDYFSDRTRDRLFAAFRPVVAEKVDSVGATRAYKSLVSGLDKLPMAGGLSLDLDDYVTDQALDGLFRMVGEQERQIRSNPAARTTDLLKQVFGR